MGESEKVITALYENNKAIELNAFSMTHESLLGNIYIGRVQKVAKHIGAAFIEITKGVVCYYALDDCKRPIYTKKINSKDLVAGDELLVQVSREASKTKPPTLTANLNITGKYLVLTTGKLGLGVSNKITGDKRKQLKEMMKSEQTDGYGFIVRTNAKSAAVSELQAEMRDLIGYCNEFQERAKFLSCYTVVSKMEEAWLTTLRDINRSGLEAIITDDTLLYKQMETMIQEKHPEDLHYLQFYEDKLLPLEKLYNVEGAIDEALRERIWLKSGAYLVIQPTEALTVIDVNTGKYESKKKKQDTFLKINLEAAIEIARQLRLRNLSGMIVVDFINMDSEEHKQELLAQLDKLLRKDAVKTVLVDMTPLNLVEITRKKQKKPLGEQLK